MNEKEIIARLVPLSAPVGESEAEFWRRQALERSQIIANLRHEVANLRAGLEEAMAELQRIEEEGA